MAGAQSFNSLQASHGRIFVLFTRKYSFGHRILFVTYIITGPINPLTTHGNDLLIRFAGVNKGNGGAADKRKTRPPLVRKGRAVALV